MEIPPYLFIIPNSFVDISYLKYVPSSETNENVVEVDDLSKKSRAPDKYWYSEVYPKSFLCLSKWFFRVLLPFPLTKSLDKFLSPSYESVNTLLERLILIFLINN